MSAQTAERLPVDPVLQAKMNAWAHERVPDLPKEAQDCFVVTDHDPGYCYSEYTSADPVTYVAIEYSNEHGYLIKHRIYSMQVDEGFNLRALLLEIFAMPVPSP